MYELSLLWDLCESHLCVSVCFHVSVCVVGDFRPVSDRAAGGCVCRGGDVRTSCGHQEESAEDQNLPKQQRHQPSVGRGANRLQKGEIQRRETGGSHTAGTTLMV